MITEDGKEIISKYLLGYVPSYASHIAIGCGARPRTVASVDITTTQIASNVAIITTESLHYFKEGEWVEISGAGTPFNGIVQISSIVNETRFEFLVTAANQGPTTLSPQGSVRNYYGNKKKLDFEMARVPIVSKGFVDDNGTTKLSLIAELPSENRYEITELGLWSSPNNPLAINSDSRIIFSFTESWQAHGSSVYDPELKGQNSTNPLGDTGNITDGGDKIFYALSGDSNLTIAQRKKRSEGSRFLSRTLLVRGDSCSLPVDGVSGRLVPTAVAGETEPLHIHLNNVNFDISNNSPSDILSFAFCLVDKTGIGDTLPDTVKILIEFYRNEISTANGFAKKEIVLDGSVFNDNRYHALSFPISDLITSEDFSSKEIRVCRIYSSVVSGGTPSSNHYISFDGLRIDNISTENPVHKMSGYSIVKNSDAYPITKKENTVNFVEFRFNIGVA